jgi:3-phosphoshikimate 1-carboxyvinyltransferase
MDEHFTRTEKFSGQVEVPGDKSISHRALIFSGLASGTGTIEGLAQGQDVQSTAGCMQALGVGIEPAGEPGRKKITGVGETSLNEPAGILDAGNSGTTMRLLSGVLAAQPFSSTITGDKYLRRRPMRRIIEPLARMGALIESTGDWLAPLTFTGDLSLKGISYRLPVASAQVKSCVLLAGLFAEGTTTVIEETPSRDHTERMLPLFGVEVDKRGHEISVHGGSRLKAVNLRVPGDPSSAAFFAAAASIVPGGRVTVRNICLNPTRASFFDVLESMGALVGRLDQRRESGEPVADLLVEEGSLKGAVISGDILPSLIDEVPVLAVVATQAAGITRIEDASELRVKETDRLAAVAENLKRMGAKVREFPEGLEIEGPCNLRGAEIDSFGDHRIAMAFSVAALVAEGETVIRRAECADISFPGFYSLLRGLCA